MCNPKILLPASHHVSHSSAAPKRRSKKLLPVTDADGFHVWTQVGVSEDARREAPSSPHTHTSHQLSYQRRAERHPHTRRPLLHCPVPRKGLSAAAPPTDARGGGRVEWLPRGKGRGERGPDYWRSGAASRWRASLKWLRRGGGLHGGGCWVWPPSAVEVEAVVADWMLDFACHCLCRHFREGCAAEFQRWTGVAQAIINGLSNIPTHQKKTVYLCQLLIRIAKGKNLECHFENDQRISPLESALSCWTSLEREEIKLEKLHEDIRRLIQVQVVAVHMENGYFKEAAEVLERLFTGSDSDKPLRMKLATIIKNKDPYIPLLESFSYSLLISKIKSYIELFMRENETNFLLQAATKEIESKGSGARLLQNTTVNVHEKDKRNLETKRRPRSRRKCGVRGVLQSLNNLQNVEEHEDSLACYRRRQRWTCKEDLELKSGVKEFGVGNWAKILVHGDFNNRTNVMLKDRWRTLCKIKQG
ncbi:PREDICTED: telomeric repeat-binding factor 1 [Mesitornis unicolor]|uniref:telomeric repeat-binding factor 1 n=1 Tax=Mesitornis unicolor TaxID=54374 RepID=UPI0005280E1B|nr:PREDICTED: telomeric repeat-binding factor 1 [Mesitornis unicolor]